MPSEKQAIMFGLKKELYKKSFYQFVQDAVKVLEPSTNFLWNWHIKYLCERLQAEAFRVQRGEPRLNDLIINVPFRSMKSLIVSVCYNAWIWTFFPECKIMTISYSETLAIKQAFLTKIILRSPWYGKYFPEVMIMKDDNQKGTFTNTNGGTRQSFGLNSGITGSGCDIQICDDPNKVSETKKQLETSNEIYDEMIFNRVNDPETAFRLVVQQRVNANDLTGHLLGKDGEWELVNLPAELNDKVRPMHLVEFYKDGLFWVKRFGRKMLKQYHIMLGTRGYNAQLQQTTSSDGGNILKEQWFRIQEHHKVFDTLSYDLYVDPAFTSKKHNDPTGLMIASKLNNDLVVKKAYAKRLEFPDLIKHITSVCSANGIRKIYVEPKGSGLSLVQQLRRETKLNVIELPAPDKDKETRVNAVSPIIEGGRIILIDGSWVKSFIDECINFPLAKHDDMVDCLEMAISKNLKGRKFNYGM